MLDACKFSLFICDLIGSVLDSLLAISFSDGSLQINNKFHSNPHIVQSPPINTGDDSISDGTESDILH